MKKAYYEAYFKPSIAVFANKAMLVNKHIVCSEQAHANVSHLANRTYVHLGPLESRLRMVASHVAAY